MKRTEKLKKKNNLIYSRTEEEREPHSRSWVIITLVILFAGLMYLVFFSEIFDIKKVEVEGYRFPKTIQAVVREKKEESFFSKNIFFCDTKKIKNVLFGDQRIENIKIIKIYPSTLRIEIKEANPSIIWVSAGDKFLVSDRGVVIGDARDENLTVIYDAANIDIKMGERVASPTFIKFIKNINDGFEGATGTKINKITLFDLLTDIHILSSDGWTVYMDGSKDPGTQLKNLGRVLEEARKSKKKLEYIDLRIETRIFYK